MQQGLSEITRTTALKTPFISKFSPQYVTLNNRSYLIMLINYQYYEKKMYFCKERRVKAKKDNLTFTAIQNTRSMRETNFIKQKKDKWIELEKTMKQSNPDPDTLNNLFVQVTDDLSYARTFYKNRSVRVYLNGIAQKVFRTIYKNKKRNVKKLLTFWTEDLPRVMYQSRRELLFANLLFWIPFIIGCLSGSLGEDGEFARQMLGDDYIDLTLANIESGDPMAIYKNRGAFAMFTSIWLNNTAVSLRFFAMGALFSLGSIIEMIGWGIHVGAFQYFFHEQGKLLPSILGIWTHGSSEIPASILAGTAGIVLGKGLVFPGTYSRGEAFLISAKRGLKIIIGILPLIFWAAIVESYVTRLTDTADVFRAFFIFSNFLFIFGYFVFYPYYKYTHQLKKQLPLIALIAGVAAVLLFIILWFSQSSDIITITLLAYIPLVFITLQTFMLLGRFKEKVRKDEEEIIPSSQVEPIHFGLIKSAGQIFKETFVILKRNFSGIARLSFITSSIYVSIVFLLNTAKPSEIFNYPARLEDVMGGIYTGITRNGILLGAIEATFRILGDTLNSGSQFLHYINGLTDIKFFANVLVYAIISKVSLDYLKREKARSINAKFVSNTFQQISQFIGLLSISWVFNAILAAGVSISPFFYLAAFSLFPFILLWSARFILENENISSAGTKAFKLFFLRIIDGIGLYIILIIISAMIWSLFFSPMLMFFIRNFGYNFSLSQSSMDDLTILAVTFLAQMMFGFISSLMITGFGLYYYSQIEIKEAKTLGQEIEFIGIQKRIRGLEREG